MTDPKCYVCQKDILKSTYVKTVISCFLEIWGRENTCRRIKHSEHYLAIWGRWRTRQAHWWENPCRRPGSRGTPNWREALKDAHRFLSRSWGRIRRRLLRGESVFQSPYFGRLVLHTFGQVGIPHPSGNKDPNLRKHTRTCNKIRGAKRMALIRRI